MTIDVGWLSVVPPTITIIVAIMTKRVLPSLLLGIVTSQIILNPGTLVSVPHETIDYVLSVAIEPGNFRLVLFSLLIGSLLELIRRVRGFDALAHAMSKRREGLSKATVYGTTFGIGTSLFLEVWSNVLVNSTAVAPLFDSIAVARERMAYFVHTVAIAVVSLVPINGWSAFYLALLVGQGIDAPFNFLISAIPYFYYSWLSLLLVGIVMVSGFALGPIRRFDAEAESNRSATEGPAQMTDRPGSEQASHELRLTHMVVPLVTLVFSVVACLYVTGDGVLAKGDGSRAILYGVCIAICVTAVMLVVQRRLTTLEVEECLVRGMSKFVGISLLLVLALSIGSLCQDIGTGKYIAQLVQAEVPLLLLPSAIFILSAVISFATGTSYGTFSIMVPIALPIAYATEMNAAIAFGAVISGGVFGDNCSPISDTTIVTCMGSNVEVIDHVRTQLPFALIAAVVCTVAFVVTMIV